jgi:hypothetical protein
MMPTKNIIDVNFLYGALTMVGVTAVYQAYQLTQAPSIASIQKRNDTPLPQIGDDLGAEVVIWGFDAKGEHAQWNLGVCDNSPYVGRIEAFLRLIKQDYVKGRSKGLSENPRYDKRRSIYSFLCRTRNTHD